MCISWNFNETDLVSFFFFFLGVVYRKFLFLHQIRKINGPGLPLKERELEKPASSQGWALGAGGIQTSWQHFFVHFPQFDFTVPTRSRQESCAVPPQKKGGEKSDRPGCADRQRECLRIIASLLPYGELCLLQRQQTLLRCILSTRGCVAGMCYVGL